MTWFKDTYTFYVVGLNNRSTICLFAIGLFPNTNKGDILFLGEWDEETLCVQPFKLPVIDVGRVQRKPRRQSGAKPKS